MVKRNRPTRHVPINDRGYAINEGHPRSKLTDADIDLIHWLHEEGMSYGKIAAKFDDGVSVSKSHVRDIIKGRRRGQLPKGWRPCA